MARAPVPGACKSRLASAIGGHDAAQIQAAMTRDAISRYQRLALGSKLILFAAPEHDGARRLRELVDDGWQVIEQQGEDRLEREGLGRTMERQRLRADAGMQSLQGRDQITQELCWIVVVGVEREPSARSRESLEPFDNQRRLAKTCRSGNQAQFTMQAIIQPVDEVRPGHDLRP